MKIHCGLTVAVVQVDQDAARRAALVEERGSGLLDVETEVAGLMGNSPCLAIRGIYDHAESNRYEARQEHAAAVTSPFTKQSAGLQSIQDTLYQTTRPAGAIKDNVTDATHMLLEDSDAEIMHWLSPKEFGVQQSDVLTLWHRETCQWFLASSAYQDWLQSNGKTLYCPGLPGVGKTVMASAAIHDITQHFSQNPEVGIAYLYFSFSRQREQTVEHVLASIIMQLSSGLSFLPDYIHDLYTHHREHETQPTHNELYATLKRLVSGYEQVIIILDALDECTTENQCRSRITKYIMCLTEKAGVNVLATSRILPSITSILGSRVSTFTFPIEAQDGDIRVALRSRMQDYNPDLLDKHLLDEHLLETMISEIVRATQGVFLLAQMHLDAILGLPTQRHIKRAVKILNTGPSTLDKLYEEAMRRIECQRKEHSELAKTILAWVVHARRPLSILEIRHALSVQLIDKVKDDDTLTIERLKSVCAGLITVEEDCGKIQLIHHTAQQYFVTFRERWFQDAQTKIAEVCISYLSLPGLAGRCATDQEFEQRLITWPFYSYAAHEWGHHALASTSIMGLTKFLKTGDQLEGSIQALFAANSGFQTSGYSQRTPRDWTGLHLAAYFGLYNITKEVLHHNHINARDNSGRTALSWAAENGHSKVVSLLINTGEVDINHHDHDGESPLSYGARNGHEEVVRLLIGTGDVDVGSRYSKYGRSPLSWAAENGHAKVVTLLIHTRKVDVDSRDNDGWSPLSWAAGNGHLGVVQLLLNTGRLDADSRDEDGQSPMWWAAQGGHAEVVKLLLDSGKVDVDSRDDNGQSPLLRAAGSGHLEVVKLLVNTGKVDVDSRDAMYGQSPLLWAAQCGHTEVVRLLLSTGKVDIDSCDASGQSPLARAAANSHTEIVKLLVATSEAHVNSCYGHKAFRTNPASRVPHSSGRDMSLLDGSWLQRPFERSYRHIAKHGAVGG